MSDAEAIEIVRNGGRAVVEQSLHPELTADAATCPHGRGWRTIVCDGDTDVIECPKCGAQRLAKCNFDEEYD